MIKINNLWIEPTAIYSLELKKDDEEYFFIAYLSRGYMFWGV